MAGAESSLDPSALVHVMKLLRRAWLWTRRIAIAAVIAAGALILLEWIHVHELLAGVHPWLAWGFSGLALALLVAFAAWIAWRWLRVPRVVVPPELPERVDNWTGHQLASYLRFARRYLERQEMNPHLGETSRREIPAALAAIRDVASRSPAPGDAVELVEREIDRIMEPLDRKARREVWQSASQVAVLTAVNPSAMLDVLITLLRNLELSARVAELYYGRPGVFGSLRIARDVLAVAATAGIVERVADSAASVAAEMMGSWTARVAGPVGQGLTNGLLTLRLGDATVLRCRSLRSRRVGIKPWSVTMWREMARRLAASAGDRLAPEFARAFRGASQPAAARVGRVFSGLRDAVRGSDPRDAAPELGLWPAVLPESD